MLHPETGKIDPDRFGWDNQKTGGARLGTQISVNIGPINIDGTSTSALWLGFSKGLQYAGLENENAQDLPGTKEVLTNCFATTYAFLSTTDNLALVFKDMFGGAGGNNIFDALIMEPTHFISDAFVNYEMCEVNRIVDQVKAMAGLDYAALADNASREILVLAMESPEAFNTINELYEAGKCAAEVAADFADELE